MEGKRILRRDLAVLALACICGTVAARAWARPEQRDFLSPAEADKIREAKSPNDRVRLFVLFADDRMKKFQYELSRKEASQNRDVLLNGLLNGYTGCIDEATDRLQEAETKGADMRTAVKEMQKLTKESLETLRKVEASSGPDLDSFKDTLDDAIEATQDALNEANKAAKEYGAVPIRRKP
ncbi:MAG TPA: hypothetical protein VGT03_02475 [Candidatus Acidoferrales bacterium]|nr:hypothetical protein [Candidatus Acidoferrales bacterium]